MKVLNFGSLNIDFVYSLDHFVQKGETISSEELNIYSGGKGLNQSIAMGRAGVPVYHAGAIGSDGQFLLDEMQKAGVDTGFVRKLEIVRTGNAIIQKEKSGDNCIILYGGANQSITRKQIDETLSHFDEGDFIILQNEINEMSYLIEKAYDRGMVIILNPSPMDDKVLQMPLKLVSYFILNEIEAAQILCLSEDEAKAAVHSGMTDINTEIDELSRATNVAAKNGKYLVRALTEKFPQSKIILTLGENGSLFAEDRMLHYQPIYRIRVMDTTAAGDTFTGYLIAGILNGFSIARTMDIAAKASAITVSKAGAAPSIPTMSQVENTGFWESQG